jgi:quercetin dioxygenase-like cupin family protein
MTNYAIVNLLEVEDSVDPVVSGSGRVRLGHEVRELRRWDVLRVAPEVVRGFEAGADGLEIIAIGGPKPEGGDGVRTDDPWPDARAE